MTAMLAPMSSEDLVDAVCSTPRVIATGGGTKPRLSATDAVRLSTAALRGIVEYEPSEFTFTARAGTPIREIGAELAEQGQYLPFDPVLVDAGATLGGTVASGLNGPGRFRFGGVRDFILGVRVVDGEGRLLRLGGKVVKNAAGFDLPKFFVGSLGRFGVLAEITLKVFPRPASRLTLRLDATRDEDAARLIIDAARSRWDPEAIDYLPAAASVYLRLSGPATSLPLLAREVLARWSGEPMTPPEADARWTDITEFRWTHAGGVLLKMPSTPTMMATIREALGTAGDARVQFSAGGHVAWVSIAAGTPASDIDRTLQQSGLTALTLRGDGPLWWGSRSRPQIARAVKAALDGPHRFPSLDD
jgi:glycolate oxidase FAD binding subunit